MEAGKKHPPLPKGINEALLNEFLATLSFTGEYGYDPEKHFRKSFSQSVLNYRHLMFADRQGTNVLPEYQRKGIGKMLSLRCNELADKAGAKTFVIAGPKGMQMLQKTGFEILVQNEIDMKNFDAREEDRKSWVMVREPQGKSD